MPEPHLSRPGLLFLLCLVAAPVIGAAAQEPASGPENPAFWLTGGVGGSSDGVALVLGADLLSRSGILLSARSTFATRILDDEFQDYAVLVGRMKRGANGGSSISVGLAATGGRECDGFLGSCRQLPWRLGIPVAARAAWHPLPVLGFGVYGFANLNSEHSFGGIALTLELGNLRRP